MMPVNNIHVGYPIKLFRQGMAIGVHVCRTSQFRRMRLEGQQRGQQRWRGMFDRLVCLEASAPSLVT